MTFCASKHDLRSLTFVSGVDPSEIAQLIRRFVLVIFFCACFYIVSR